MRNFLKIFSICLWILTFGIFVNALLHHDLWRLTLIIAYNRIHGIFGWSLMLAIFSLILSFLVRPKKVK